MEERCLEAGTWSKVEAERKKGAVTENIHSLKRSRLFSGRASAVPDLSPRGAVKLEACYMSCSLVLPSELDNGVLRRVTISYIFRYHDEISRLKVLRDSSARPTTLTLDQRSRRLAAYAHSDKSLTLFLQSTGWVAI